MFYSCMLAQNSAFAANEESQPAQVMVDIYDPPIPFAALDRFYLVYELYLTNFYNTDITLDAIQIHDKDTNTPLLGFDKNSLRKMIGNTCAENTPCNDLIIPVGGMKLVYMLLPFNSQNDLPKDIIQRIFVTKKDDGSQAELKTLPLKVNKSLTVMVRPPVKGDYWVATNGLAAFSPHRSAHSVLNGQNYFAQRYAIDFIQIDLDGKPFQGNEHVNESYYAYGKDVASVARGTVVAIKDNIPDNKPQLTAQDEKKLGKFTPDTVAGNYVVVELTKGLYAFYAHLRPGSLKVKVGEKVAEGQNLAQIGNSGQSKLPHLHFHIVDKPAYFAGNGIPYTFTEFWLRPSELVDNGTQKLFKFTETPDGLKRYNNQALLENAVVKFNDEGRYNKERQSAFSNEDDDDYDNGRATVKGIPGKNSNMNSGSQSAIVEDNFRQSTSVRSNSVIRSDSTNNNNPNMQRQQQPGQQIQYSQPGQQGQQGQQGKQDQQGFQPRAMQNGERNSQVRSNRAQTQKRQTNSNRDPLFQGLRTLFGVD